MHTSLRTSIEAHFRSEDKEAIEAILNCHGAIFGGYLRDCIAGDTPNDIDVVVSEKHWEALHHALGPIYGPSLCGPLGSRTSHFRKEGLVAIEVIETEDDPGDTILGPACTPDFDVNTLVYSREHGLRSWVTGSSDLQDILEHIEAKTRTQFNSECYESRKSKILKRGYTILE